MNPFFTAYDTPNGTIPFSKIELAHFKPAVLEGIKREKEDIERITANPETPTFENTLAELDRGDQTLSRATSVFFNLLGAETNEDMQKLAQEISPLLTAHGNDVMMNKALFSRIKAIYDGSHDHLSAEQKTLLEKTYKSFVRNGANLPDDKKETLREIDKKLSMLSLTFGEHVLKENNAYELHLTDKNDLDGLPDSSIETAEALAKAKGKEGWIFTLDYPSYLPFMKYSKRRELRKELWRAFGQKGFQNNENNNEQIIKDMVRLRDERAKLLGFASHADYVLAERMAQNPQKVKTFLNDLKEKAMPFAQKDFDELATYAKDLDGLEQLEKWDVAYYTQKLKKERFNIDDEVLRPYFPLQKVVDGVFLTAQKLYGLSFKKREDIDVYHKDVTVYEVTDQEGNHVAIFYADFFPRPGKRQGAWMTIFRDQNKVTKEEERPHISIVCNFTKPTESKPSLLTFNEVTTLFHEFGHALHGMLSNVTYKGISCTNVYWDFVELPSQIFENWCYEKECLDLFAHHYETGEPIPEEHIEKIKASANFREGSATIRQLSLGLLDMGWHDGQADLSKSVKALEEQFTEGLSLYPKTPDTCTSTSFSHIFQGGYSSGYYSYKWAEVLEADAFEAFKEKGIFNSEVAQGFKEHILSAGGSEHPSILYKRFRGREAKIDALLRRAGLVEEKSEPAT